MSFCVQGLQLLKKPKNQISFLRHFKLINLLIQVGFSCFEYKHYSNDKKHKVINVFFVLILLASLQLENEMIREVLFFGRMGTATPMI